MQARPPRRLLPPLEGPLPLPQRAGGRDEGAVEREHRDTRDTSAHPLLPVTDHYWEEIIILYCYSTVAYIHALYRTMVIMIYFSSLPIHNNSIIIIIIATVYCHDIQLRQLSPY